MRLGPFFRCKRASPDQAGAGPGGTGGPLQNGPALRIGQGIEPLPEQKGIGLFLPQGNAVFGKQQVAALGRAPGHGVEFDAAVGTPDGHSELFSHAVPQWGREGGEVGKHEAVREERAGRL